VNLRVVEMQGDLALEPYYNNGREGVQPMGVFSARPAGRARASSMRYWTTSVGAIEVQSGLLSFNRSTSFANGTVHFRHTANGFRADIAVSGTATLAGSLAPR